MESWKVKWILVFLSIKHRHTSGTEADVQHFHSIQVSLRWTIWKKCLRCLLGQAIIFFKKDCKIVSKGVWTSHTSLYGPQ